MLEPARASPDDDRVVEGHRGAGFSDGVSTSEKPSTHLNLKTLLEAGFCWASRLGSLASKAAAERGGGKGGDFGGPGFFCPFFFFIYFPGGIILEALQQAPEDPIVPAIGQGWRCRFGLIRISERRAQPPHALHHLYALGMGAKWNAENIEANPPHSKDCFGAKAAPRGIGATSTSDGRKAADFRGASRPGEPWRARNSTVTGLASTQQRSREGCVFRRTAERPQRTRYSGKSGDPVSRDRAGITQRFDSVACNSKAV